MTKKNGLCPCGTGDAYAVCCGRYHLDEVVPPTAEKLMRSRYSAFALEDGDYLLRTWHPDTRPFELELDTAIHWTGLEILGSTRGTMFDTEGTVEFRASYRSPEGAGSQQELSNFVREGGRWYYLDAQD
ncbi:hypothetical protein D1871_20090 [Nakamurella silvestris]|nr:hypothetical protein D1871_20090 [Nakamurella silvestris]